MLPTACPSAPRKPRSATAIAPPIRPAAVAWKRCCAMATPQPPSNSIRDQNTEFFSRRLERHTKLRYPSPAISTSPPARDTPLSSLPRTSPPARDTATSSAGTHMFLGTQHSDHSVLFIVSQEPCFRSRKGEHPMNGLYGLRANQRRHRPTKHAHWLACLRTCCKEHHSPPCIHTSIDNAVGVPMGRTVLSLPISRTFKGAATARCRNHRGYPHPYLKRTEIPGRPSTSDARAMP